jgi:predicted RNA-binding Zn-ribbon protein involved in translation (DUF1610 family)
LYAEDLHGLIDNQFIPFEGANPHRPTAGKSAWLSVSSLPDYCPMCGGDVVARKEYNRESIVCLKYHETIGEIVTEDLPLTDAMMSEGAKPIQVGMVTFTCKCGKTSKKRVGAKRSLCKTCESNELSAKRRKRILAHKLSPLKVNVSHPCRECGKVIYKGSIGYTIMHGGGLKPYFHEECLAALRGEKAA